MVVLSESPQDYLDKGFTTDKMAASFKQIARDYGMPMDTSERPRMAATLPACRAVVAARVHSDRGWLLLRALRVRHFSGQLLDDPEARERLVRAGAREHPVGTDGFWTSPDRDVADA
jgi:predicted DsbA family dithiol-disulfide isomerase